MTNTTLAHAPQVDAQIVEAVVVGGDLGKISAEQRVSYYKSVCESLGLNPLTQPFAYIKLNGKLTLYTRREATDQLRRLHHVSVTITDRRSEEGIYIVTARATDKQGRTDESIGAVPLANLKGEARANAIMKAETKAKRRATLALVGLGWLDETEVISIPNAPVLGIVDMETGELPAPAPNGNVVGQLDGLTAEQEAEFTAELAKKAPDIQAKTGDWRPAPAHFAAAMQRLRAQPDAQPAAAPSAVEQAELEARYAEDAARQDAAQAAREQEGR